MSEPFGEFIARLTDNARVSLQHAEAIARSQGSPHIGTEHILLGVLSQGSSVGARLLADAGVSLQRAELALHFKTEPIVGSLGMMTLSETALLTIKMAHDQARELHQEYLGTEHILYSILRQKSSRGTVLLRDMNADIEQLIESLEMYFDRQGSEHMESLSTKKVSSAPKRGLLEVFGDNLTAKAREGKLDTVIGRGKEIERLVTILSRRTKNNPVLIGEPGVGKTAIVEGAAQVIAYEKVPVHLLDMQVIQLDLAGLVAGTKYRGEFEERLKKLVNEIRNRDDVILFIDELHLLTGAGQAEGAMDAANILKPALARGHIRLIGATTLDEYRKHIEPDAALERRFQAIVVKEPSPRDTLSILKGIRAQYEEHHQVVLSDEVLQQAVSLADRYVTDRYRPDKAIDVIDEASALARIYHGVVPSELREIMHELSKLKESLDEAFSEQEYERAAIYKTHLAKLQQRAEKLQESEKQASRVTINEAHLAKAVSNMTGIPVDKVESSELRLLKRLEKHLGRSVIGQDEAIQKVARAVRRSRSGISSGDRPIGSFVFMGPTGVGKTELARVLAKEVFGSDDALVKIDMSEFKERHSTSRLLGAPAGFVGYEDGGKLTDKIRRQPYSVVLFDEIEKAHPDVFQLLLQLLEDGILTDAKGKQVSFRNTIVILTSNLGTDSFVRESQLGFQAHSVGDRQELEALHKENTAATNKALERFMQPELINRFDAIVTFRALTRPVVSLIFDNLVTDTADRLLSKGVGLKIQPSAKRFLIDEGFKARQGARPLRRLIEDRIEHQLAEYLLGDEVAPGDTVQVGVRQRQLVFKVVQGEAAVV
ncbi:MAG TPA: ATP-dependent Clp protease ATP-binding subunit [Candidatus Saccharibacteria bacterium]|nr:ATP-dependent Clp protease ATP-binding subunit [Candidatus Saccharibacteria bacterium]HMR38230.1 ATP-dependent Clp protease ATP-binding subunit [Candidatus Saccharibacteria bacterium]